MNPRVEQVAERGVDQPLALDPRASGARHAAPRRLSSASPSAPASPSSRTRPIVISTLVNTEIAAIVGAANALFLDCFEIFISPLEKELGVRASHAIGRSHSANDLVNYYHRIDAVNYALGHDDGIATRDLADADIILVGVSRSGKTPTCLYMAMQFGIRAANYPLVPEDFSSMQLPGQVRSLRGRLYGLTIKPERLEQIRNERRPGSQYATRANCEFEVRQAEALMRYEYVSDARELGLSDSLRAKPLADAAAAIEQALDNPIGTRSLARLAEGKSSAAISVCARSRSAPSCVSSRTPPDCACPISLPS